MTKIILGTPITSIEPWKAIVERIAPNRFEVVHIEFNRPVVDILVFDGGADVSPSLYNAKKHPKTVTNIARDTLETNIFKDYSGNTYIAGICRGHQFVNVMMGGTLHQHLPDIGKDHFTIHSVHKEKDTGVPFDMVQVSSLHHQAVATTGQLMQVTYREPDTGVIEGTESLDGSIRTLQSHPERFYRPDTDTKLLWYLLFRDVFGSEY